MRLPDRKQMRLKNFDYSSEGAYFVTACLQNRLQLFENQQAKEMIEKWILKIEEKYEVVKVDYFVVMGDHIHIIIFINEKCQIDLPRIMKWFKSMTTNEYILCVREGIYEPFEKKFWQRSYYDHIIRNEEDLNEKREYILNNPEKEYEKSTYIRV